MEIRITYREPVRLPRHSFQILFYTYLDRDVRFLKQEDNSKVALTGNERGKHFTGQSIAHDDRVDYSHNFERYMIAIHTRLGLQFHRCARHYCQIDVVFYLIVSNSYQAEQIQYPS
jgi:hypothetical protein